MPETALSAPSERRLCELYRTTPMSLRDLAAIFGLSHEGVRRALKRNRVPLKPPGGNLTKGQQPTQEGTNDR